MFGQDVARGCLDQLAEEYAKLARSSFLAGSSINWLSALVHPSNAGDGTGNIRKPIVQIAWLAIAGHHSGLLSL